MKDRIHFLADAGNISLRPRVETGFGGQLVS